MLNKIRESKAFTLIELIVVVGIIGILVGIAGPMYNGFVDKSRVAAIKSDVKVAEGIVAVDIARNENLDKWLETEDEFNIKDIAVEGKLYDTTGLIDGSDIASSEFWEVEKSYISSNLGGKFYTDKMGDVYYKDTKGNPGALKKYTLNVVGGSGSGEYRTGEEVLINPIIPDGSYFKGWSVKGVSVDESSSSELKFTMPSNNVSVELSKGTIYNVSVSGGSGSGKYKPGDLVKVSAENEAGYEFTSWEIDGIAIENTGSSSIEFVMPENDVTVSTNVVYVAQDSDFKWVGTRASNGNTHSYDIGKFYKGYFEYTGSEKIVKIPDVIDGHDMTSYYNMFHETDVEKIISTNKNITNMYGAFIRMNSKKLDLSEFNTSGVTNMEHMFAYAKTPIISLEGLDVSSVKSVDNMFFRSESHKIDLGSNFNSDSLESTTRMFNESEATEITGLENMNTNNVSGMGSMFRNTKVKSLDLSGMVDNNIEDFSNMFEGSVVKSVDLTFINVGRNMGAVPNIFKDSSLERVYFKSESDITTFQGRSATNSPWGLRYLVK